MKKSNLIFKLSVVGLLLTNYADNVCASKWALLKKQTQGAAIKTKQMTEEELQRREEEKRQREEQQRKQREEEQKKLEKLKEEVQQKINDFKAMFDQTAIFGKTTIEGLKTEQECTDKGNAIDTEFNKVKTSNNKLNAAKIDLKDVTNLVDAAKQSINTQKDKIKKEANDLEEQKKLEKLKEEVQQKINDFKAMFDQTAIFGKTTIEGLKTEQECTDKEKAIDTEFNKVKASNDKLNAAKIDLKDVTNLVDAAKQLINTQKDKVKTQDNDEDAAIKQKLNDMIKNKEPVDQVVNNEENCARHTYKFMIQYANELNELQTEDERLAFGLAYMNILDDINKTSNSQKAIKDTTGEDAAYFWYSSGDMLLASGEEYFLGNTEELTNEKVFVNGNFKLGKTEQLIVDALIALSNGSVDKKAAYEFLVKSIKDNIFAFYAFKNDELANNIKAAATVKEIVALIDAEVSNL